MIKQPWLTLRLSHLGESRVSLVVRPFDPGAGLLPRCYHAVR
jgi:hypothetical protein